MVAGAEEGERGRRSSWGLLQRLALPEVVSTFGEQKSNRMWMCDFPCPGGAKGQGTFSTGLSPNVGHSTEVVTMVCVAQDKGGIIT